MNFSILNSIRSIIRPIHSVVSDVASLEQAIYETERNKCYWLNKNSISCSSVAKIQDLKGLGKDGYSSFVWQYGKSALDLNELKQALTNIFEVKKIPKITIDISEVGGLSASKSPIDDYCTMQQFVEKECLRFFELSEESLSKNLAHQEIRILHRENTSDHLRMYGWSDKLFLCNGGGSHHFASAQYIANKLSKNIPITGEMVLTYINEAGLSDFLKTYSSILIPYSDFCYLTQKFDLSGLSMVFYQSPCLPAETAILFYKHNDLPSSLDSLLKNRFTDFNTELVKFFNFQKTNTQFNDYKGS